MPRAGSSTIPGALKRYQACHKCRRRKLKCDGGNPCSNCLKSHETASKYDPASTPTEPSCVYDAPDLKVLGPKARIAALETEIEDLQELLRAANDRLAQCTCGAAHIQDSQHELGDFPPMPSPLATGSGLHTPGFTYSDIEFNTTPPPVLNFNQVVVPPPPIHPSIEELLFTTQATEQTPGMYELSLNLWPLNIPPPATLFHLVEIFFSSVPMATRLIHKPTFMSNLNQVPTSLDFPHVSVLHAICAIASIYSPIIPKAAAKSPNSYRSHMGVFQREPEGRQYFPRRVEDVLDPVPQGFAATHARWAAESMKPSVRLGDRGLQLLQASLILVWFHYSTGQTIPLYLWLGLMTRYSIPLGVNVAEGFEPLSSLPPEMLFLWRTRKPTTPVEFETWRNILWVTYVTERIYAAGIVWPLVLQDEDISQIMPCRFSDFMSGTFVPSQGRQQIFTENMLLHHPTLSTDSWTLYIKASMLVSKVRVFNGRYRTEAKARRLDPDLDPTSTEEFKVLDRTISAFIQSIPRAFREPVGTTVDSLLYMAHILPHMAMIQLHDPHAQLGQPDNYSSMQLLGAARDTLDLIYKICATSYDVIYLDHACGFGWFLAGTTLIRFLGAKMDARDQEEIALLKQEIATVRFMLTKLGERIPMGMRQVALLDEMYDQSIRPREQAASEGRGMPSQSPFTGSTSSGSSHRSYPYSSISEFN